MIPWRRMAWLPRIYLGRQIGRPIDATEELDLEILLREKALVSGHQPAAH